jgi:hypothetical protein
MRITLEIPETAFLKAKSPEQIVKEARDAAILYWVLRGDMDRAEALQEVPPPSRPQDFWAALASMPNVCEDEDFERPLDLGREDPFAED